MGWADGDRQRRAGLLGAGVRAGQFDGDQWKNTSVASTRRSVSAWEPCAEAIAPKNYLNQPVTVMVDSGAKAYRDYPGTITWIADKAEFTPKTIQTKEERANLVYAIKVRVPNDGYLKIGMYGEVQLNTEAK